VVQALRDMGIGLGELTRSAFVSRSSHDFSTRAPVVEEFARGLETIVVIEEKRSFLELQLRELLYNAPTRPVIVGKLDEKDQPLLPPVFELDPEPVANVLARFLPGRESHSRAVSGSFAEISSRDREKVGMRMPNFCPGCPHKPVAAPS